jgi:hypothetical protein
MPLLVDTPPNHWDADKRHDECWKADRIARIIDVACSASQQSDVFTCGAVYKTDLAKLRCGSFVPLLPTRCYGLWVSLAATTANWTYDPWAVNAPAVLHTRLAHFVKHPGFAAVC